MSTTLHDLTSISALAERTGICERTIRYWVNTDLGSFRRECTIKIGGRRLVNLPKTTAWLKRFDNDDTPAPEAA